MGQSASYLHMPRETFYKRLTMICDSYDHVRYLKQNRFEKIYLSVNKIHVIVKC